MTNVVGILVIVLIVTQLGVSDAVKRISAKLPDVSKQEYELAKQEAAELQRLLAELDRMDSAIEPRLGNLKDFSSLCHIQESLFVVSLLHQTHL